MAASDKGVERVARSRHSNRCSALNAKGFPCGAWARRGEDVCHRHSMSDEEWREWAARGGRKRQRDRRETAGIRTPGRHRHEAPGPTLARAVEVIGELLDSTLPGSVEPNYEARAYGALAFAVLFRVTDGQRAEALELLERVRPQLAVDPQRQRLLDFERASARLVQAFKEGRIPAYDLPPEVLKLVMS